MTAIESTTYTFMKNYPVELVLAASSSFMELIDFVVKDPNGTVWNYKTDGIVSKTKFLFGPDEIECEYINAKGASYVFIYNERKIILCTYRDDYDELFKILEAALKIC